jgi:hypothetical protein
MSSIGPVEQAARARRQQLRAKFFPDREHLIARSRHRASPHPVDVVQGCVLMEMAEEPEAPKVTEVEAMIVPPVGMDVTPEVLSFVGSYPVTMYLHEPTTKRSAKAIIKLTAAAHGFRVDALAGPRRQKDLVFARHEAIWRVAMACPHLSLLSIGRLIGNRDHTTILHAIHAYDEILRAQGRTAFVAQCIEWGGLTADEAERTFDSGAQALRRERVKAKADRDAMKKRLEREAQRAARAVENGDSAKGGAK